MRARSACAALVLFCGTSSAGAQSVRLTESEFLSKVTSVSPRVQAIQASVDVARADVLSAGRWPNPRVTWNREAVAGVSEHIVSVSQLLPVTGRRGLEVESASAAADAAKLRSDEEIRRLRAEARGAFAALVSAQAREQMLLETSGRLKELAAVLAKREAGGESAGFDRLRVDREVLEIDMQRSMATAERVRARTALSAFVTTPLPDDVTAVASESRAVPVPSVDALMSMAERVRGDLSALAQDARAASLSAEAAERRRIPEPEVVGGTKSSSIGGGDIGGVIAVHASIPLFDRGQPERAMAQARVSQAQARADALRMTLRAEIAGLHDLLVERRLTADRYRQTMPESGGQIERIAQVSYEAGERGLLDLLDVHRTTSASRLQQLALDAAVRSAEIELEYVTGWEAR